MERSGQALAQLIIQRGVRHQCRYDAGYGDMTIGVSGGMIRSTLTDSGGNLEFSYSLDINSLLASENEMYIYIQEAGGSSPRRAGEVAPPSDERLM
jgi:uncharacterized beta-barrel protein YwiB (DUF1934 family)